MKATSKSNEGSKKVSNAVKRSIRQKNARFRMMASPYGKEFYKYVRQGNNSGAIYMWWLEQAMYTLGHKDPCQFLSKRTTHGLCAQLGALRVAAKKKITDANHAKNVVSIFQRYARWYKNTNEGNQLHAAA